MSHATLPSLQQLRPPKKIHFIGIGGDGMSSLAGLLHDMGFALTGSEGSDPIRTKQSAILTRFQVSGMSIHFGHRKSNVGNDVALVVISSAIADDNPELEAARARAIPVAKRADLLGELMKGAVGVAVSGTAGKTTTTAMIGTALVALGADPTVSMGASTVQFGNRNYRFGRGEYFIAEADEFDRSFLKMHYHHALVTHLFFGDHPDCYADLSELMEAFRTFVGKVPANGVTLGCGDVLEIRNVLQTISTGRTYGFALHNDWRVSIISADSTGTAFEFVSKESNGRCTLPIAGRHNVLNAMGAIALSHYLGFDAQLAADTLGGFVGCARRLEMRGSSLGVVVYDDYGHHPIQMAATLGAVRQLHPQARIACIFEPRQFLRTKLAINELADVLSKVDDVIITDISYGLGESESSMGDVHARDVVAAISSLGGSARYIPTLDDAAAALSGTVQSGHVVLTTGTGKTYIAADRLVELLDARASGVS